MFLMLLFILGLTIGSFLNCVIYRLEKNQGFILGRSFCPSCHHVLNWRDLIPLLSFISLKGKCRYCQKPISRQYPLVELLTGALFLLNFLILSPSLSAFDLLRLVYYLIVSCLLIVIFIFDLKYYLIPDQFVYSAIAVSAVWYFASSFFFSFYTSREIFNFIYSAIGSALFFLSIYLLTRKKGMGFGDVEVAFFMGLLLGFPNIIVALFLAFFSGALVGIILMVFNKKTLKSELAFGPFLTAATLFSLFFGQSLIDLYLGFLGY